jgi:hypothetical protein
MGFGVLAAPAFFLQEFCNAAVKREQGPLFCVIHLRVLELGGDKEWHEATQRAKTKI